MSKFTTLFKILEKIALSQLSTHFFALSSFNKVQSEYNKLHLCETAFLHVTETLSRARSNGRGSLLVSLDMSAFTKVGKISAPIMHLSAGVPQGSVLDSLLFVIYTFSLAKIFQKHHITSHQFADDIILTSEFSYGNPQPAVEEISKCVSSVHTWHSQNLLKLNIEKKMQCLSVLNRA